MIRWSFQFAQGCEPVAPSVEPERLDEADELRAAVGDRRRNVGEGLDAPGLDLDLGGDQLAREVALGGRPGRRGLHVLEPVDEVERDGVEQRELLLDGDREVGARVEALARLSEELVCGNALFVTHGAEKRSRYCTFDSDP